LNQEINEVENEREERLSLTDKLRKQVKVIFELTNGVGEGHPKLGKK